MLLMTTPTTTTYKIKTVSTKSSWSVVFELLRARTGEDVMRNMQPPNIVCNI